MMEGRASMEWLKQLQGRGLRKEFEQERDQRHIEVLEALENQAIRWEAKNFKAPQPRHGTEGKPEVKQVQSYSRTLGIVRALGLAEDALPPLEEWEEAAQQDYTLDYGRAQ